MKNSIDSLKHWNLKTISLDSTMLLFRVLLSLEIMIVHGMKKIGIGTTNAEVVPNPFHLPEDINQIMALAANLLFPFFFFFWLVHQMGNITYSSGNLNWVLYSSWK